MMYPLSCEKTCKGRHALYEQRRFHQNRLYVKLEVESEMRIETFCYNRFSNVFREIPQISKKRPLPIKAFSYPPSSNLETALLALRGTGLLRQPRYSVSHESISVQGPSAEHLRERLRTEALLETALPDSLPKPLASLVKHYFCDTMMVIHEGIWRLRYEPVITLKMLYPTRDIESILKEVLKE